MARDMAPMMPPNQMCEIWPYHDFCARDVDWRDRLDDRLSFDDRLWEEAWHLILFEARLPFSANEARIYEP